MQDNEISYFECFDNCIHLVNLYNLEAQRRMGSGLKKTFLTNVKTNVEYTYIMCTFVLELRILNRYKYSNIIFTFVLVKL